MLTDNGPPSPDRPGEGIGDSLDIMLGRPPRSVQYDNEGGVSNEIYEKLKSELIKTKNTLAQLIKQQKNELNLKVFELFKNISQ